MQNFVVVSHAVAVWVHVGGPKQFIGRWHPAPLGRCRGRPPRNTSLYFPTCVILPHFVALGQTVWAFYGSQKIADAEAPPPWDGGGADPLETCYSPTRVTMSNSVMLRSNCTTVIMEIRQKIDPSRAAFRGHWNRHRSIGYL